MFSGGACNLVKGLKEGGKEGAKKKGGQAFQMGETVTSPRKRQKNPCAEGSGAMGEFSRGLSTTQEEKGKWKKTQGRRFNGKKRHI